MKFYIHCYVLYMASKKKKELWTLYVWSEDEKKEIIYSLLILFNTYLVIETSLNHVTSKKKKQQQLKKWAQLKQTTDSLFFFSSF